MIVLDAATLIAFLDGDDAHHEAATRLLVDQAAQRFAVSPLNLAEVLVAPTRVGRVPQATTALERLGVEELPFPANAAVTLAELRARTGLKMPDCCVLLVALQHSADVATFDERLRRAAEASGLHVLP